MHHIFKLLLDNPQIVEKAVKTGFEVYHAVTDRQHSFPDALRAVFAECRVNQPYFGPDGGHCQWSYKGVSYLVSCGCPDAQLARLVVGSRHTFTDVPGELVDAVQTRDRQLERIAWHLTDGPRRRNFFVACAIPVGRFNGATFTQAVNDLVQEVGAFDVQLVRNGYVD